MGGEQKSILTVAVSSRALFNFEEENRVFDREGAEKYRRLQRRRQKIPGREGAAFALVRKLLALNTGGKKAVEVVVLSRNDPGTGLRVFHSTNHYKLDIERGAFTQGRSPFPYLKPFGAHLFLSANAEDVRAAINEGVPAARIFRPGGARNAAPAKEIRIAFDGDAVLFSDEAERVYQRHKDNPAQYYDYEKKRAQRPLPAGPFKPFLAALQSLRAIVKPPHGIRTALVTARGVQTHERAVRTLMKWKTEVDEALFLAGKSKEEFLRAFNPDFFFDDQTGHCETAPAPTGHVDYGVINEKKKSASKKGRKKTAGNSAA